MTRAAGIPNRNKRGMKAQLKQQFGDDFDVIMLMGKNCADLMAMIPDNPEREDSELIINANTQLEKLAQYVEPKLKAVELTGNLNLTAHEEWLEDLDHEE